ncbi:endonuclease domain-containing protein [uncultured Selenomonas sp.]|uniref:endonuclease domain-containing protein n=1 Tax=uncultured Selenomonas sp. TaxID=159275 RepID=UPI0028DC4A96|nr:endonuclease domain-containing protein [uncultured Selenomonas sp.]
MRDYGKKINQYAKSMRRAMTPEERRLWYDFLSKHPYHFRRQQPCGGYIIDFYAPTLLFAIEVDGSQHFSQDEYARDAERTTYLRERGIHLLRLTNQQIRRDFAEVCSAIENAIADIVSAGKINGVADDGHIC